MPVCVDLWICVQCAYVLSLKKKYTYWAHSKACMCTHGQTCNCVWRLARSIDCRKREYLRRELLAHLKISSSYFISTLFPSVWKDGVTYNCYNGISKWVCVPWERKDHMQNQWSNYAVPAPWPQFYLSFTEQRRERAWSDKGMRRQSKVMVGKWVRLFCRIPPSGEVNYTLTPYLYPSLLLPLGAGWALSYGIKCFFMSQ